jgi:hypothetical protein
MKVILLIFISTIFSFCSAIPQGANEENSATLTDEEMVGNQPSPDENACSYENDGSTEKPIPPTQILETRTDKAKDHCESLGGVNFERTQINAFERLNSEGDKYILWNERVFCNCDG